MSKIDIDRLVADLVEIHAKRTGIDRTIVNTYLDDALALQGLAVINNEVVVVNDRAYLNSKIERATPTLSAYRQGYADAVEKACKWLEECGGYVVNGQKCNYENFMKAMEEEK